MSGSPETGAPRLRGSPAAWALATAVTALAIVSQYFVPASPGAVRALYGSLPGAFAIVYGVPVAAFLGLVGVGPLRRWASGLGHATVEALGWYGGMSAVSFLVLFGLLITYAAIDPGLLSRLNVPNPVLAGAAPDPWFWVGFSFVVGGVEELIFRGWVFGYWLARRPGRWVEAAIGSSALFAAVHLYYGTTYGGLLPLFFVPIFLLGLAFSGAMRAGGGNLVVIALLHGAYDASAFLTLVSPSGGAAARYGLIAVGLIVLALRYVRRRPPQLPPGVYGHAVGPPPDID